MADHQLDELVGGRGRGHAGGGGATVGEHRHAVADPADLVEAVGDVDHPDPVGGEPPDDLEQGLDLALVEDRRRLVHDQQADVVGERPGDRDDLLGGRPQRADLGRGDDRLVAEPLEQRRRLAAHPVEVEQRPAPRLVGEEDALGDRQVLDQVELLVDRRDAAPRLAAGSPDRQGLAAEEDLARGRLDGARRRT